MGAAPQTVERSPRGDRHERPDPQRQRRLFQRQGFTGTGIKQILTEADAPFSSLYHFFPGGKDELGAESIRLVGRDVPASWSRPSSTPRPTW